MTLETAPGTQALLDLEDALPGVLAEPLPGSKVPFWPQVRSAFMFALQDHYFASTGVATSMRRADALRQVASSVLPSRWDPRRLRGPRPLLCLTSGTTTYRVGSTYRDWLVGDFVEAYPSESAIFQAAEIPRAAAAFEPTRSLSRITMRSAVQARLMRRRVNVSRDVERLIKEFARLIEEPIGEDRIRAIASTAAYHQAIGRYSEKAIMKVIDRLEPAVVLMQGAAYGHASSLTYALRHRGVHVAEPQHGWIGPSHGAYNFGAAMSSPELAITLPDELLTFGEYWSSGVRVPFGKTAIGKPHLEAMRRGVRDWVERPKQILLVSSVADPDRASRFGRALADALPREWALAFRPHPRERSVVKDRYAGLLAHPRVTLDEESDVYESLKTARGVVGIASTVLFEALALGCRVFAVANPVSKYYVGELFGPLIRGPEHARIVVEQLTQPLPTVSQTTLEAIWKPEATQNFRRWVDGFL